MSVSPEKILAAHKTNVETAFSAANALFSGAERLAVLNLETARNLLEGSMGVSRSVFDITDTADLTRLPADVAQPLFDKTLAYGRSIYEIQVQVLEELAGVANAQRADWNKAVYGTLDMLGKNGPAGSDVVVSALKSAVAASNAAYDNVVKTVRDAAELAEDNVMTATQATVKAARPTANASHANRTPKARKAA